MAGLTSRRGGDVRRWLGFNVRESAAVASRTAGSDATVVHGSRHKRGGAGVTGFALSSGWEVRRRFRFHTRGHAVASHTVSGDAGVVHRSWFKRCRGFMAGLASRCRRDVTWRSWFA